MNRKENKKKFKYERVFLLALIVFLSIVQTGCRNKVSDLPNIILCMADDQGWGDMAYYGHSVVKTPNFDDMARSGLRFDRFYAAAPICSPTRGSVMTGRHPNRFGCFKWGNTLRPQEITVAEALKTAGYVTGHFGKWHVGHVFTESPVNPGASGFDEWFSAPNFFDNDPILSREGKAVQTQGESSMVTVDAALEFIQKHAKDPQPFLAVVWFGSPHQPHAAIERDRQLYPGEEEDFQHFYGEITGMDRAFGKLREELKALGIRENTLLWYCSDNGGLSRWGSTGGRGYKSQIYEGGLRVPALMEWPARVKEPRTTNVPCNTSDIYPTLLEIAGIKMEKQPVLDGISLVSLIEGGGQLGERNKPMGFWQYPAPPRQMPSARLMAQQLDRQKEGIPTPDSLVLQDLNAGDILTIYPSDSLPGHAAWLDWPYKLHRILSDSGTLDLELYNLEEDPMESKNLAGQDPSQVGSMLEELKSWQRSVISSLNGEDYQ